MNIPAVPMGSGQTVEGKVSWFGGPNDHTDSGRTALGLTTATPGIAVYNRATLGGYWRVTDAKTGRSVVLRQTDLGPAPFTGRKIDVTYSALSRFGYGEHNFPTDSTFKAEYLGHNPQAAKTTAPAPIPASTMANIPGVQLDQAAFQQAQRRALVGRLIASTAGGTKDNPLFASGLVSTKQPNADEYMQQTPGPPASSTPSPSLPGKLAGFLPGNAKLTMGRIDQGQDIQTDPGGPLLAPGDGVIVAVKYNPGGFGPDYPVVRFTTGPLAGRTVYLGHTHTALKAGDKFKEGDVLSHTGKTPVGNASVPGWAEIGLASALGSGDMEAGKQIAPLLRRR